MSLFQREAYNSKVCKGYPDIPDATHFFNPKNWQYEVPRRIFGWGWSDTFGKWSALVDFGGGNITYTYPK